MQTRVRGNADGRFEVLNVETDEVIADYGTVDEALAHGKEEPVPAPEAPAEEILFGSKPEPEAPAAAPEPEAPAPVEAPAEPEAPAAAPESA